MFTINRKKIAIAVVAIVVLLAIILLLRTESPPGEPADRIYTNVYIHSVAVGGMTAEEAGGELMRRFQPGLEALTVSYTVDGEVKAELAFAEFGARFDFRPLIETAMEYSLTPAFSQRLRRIFRGTYEITDSPLFIFSAERLEDIMLELSAEFDVPMQNAAFIKEDNAIRLMAEKTGSGINIEEAAADTQEVLQSLTAGTVELQMVVSKPAHTAASFEFAPKVLGEFSTSCGCSKGDEARCRNIARAAERINNVTLYPDGVFSAAEIIGAHLPDSGYEAAIVMVQGRQSEDIGGGVCQVVTTLYNAALRAELEIVQRHNHSALVSYVGLGHDATVAGDYYDLKFKNTTGYPVLVTSSVEGRKLWVRIYGNETRPNGRVVRFEVRQVEVLPPGPYREVVDPNIPRGDRRVTQPSQVGYHVEMFKMVYKNGSLEEEIKLNTSIYKPFPGIMSIGAG